jgi:hypothetical protein
MSAVNMSQQINKKTAKTAFAHVLASPTMSLHLQKAPVLGGK